ncbi:MAG: DNA lyase [Bacteroidetes bacterium]|nr:MAG: DNA lyase [Bacteroidota bacterium]
MATKTDWSEAIKPLLRKYKNHKHPLEYKNIYQLVVMVVLSSRDTDVHINELSKEFFKKFPDMKALSKATVETLKPYIGKVRSFFQKSGWLIKMAGDIKTDANIPLSMEGLTNLPGIGRKSANVILREAGKPAEGIVVDIHVLRVAPRLGIASGTDAGKIEEQLMKKLPQKEWDAGMAMSFLGREICRPKPLCEICLMNKVCAYYKKIAGKKPAK